MSILSKVIYKVNVSPNKISMALLAQIEKFISDFMWNFKGTGLAETILKKKRKVGSLTLSDFKMYFKAIVIKTVWY